MSPECSSMMVLVMIEFKFIFQVKSKMFPMYNSVHLTGKGFKLVTDSLPTLNMPKKSIEKKPEVTRKAPVSLLQNS